MHICVVLSPRDQDGPDRDAEVVNGQEWSLHIHKTTAGGPYYPHIAESRSADSYRLFAGRIAGIRPSGELPAGHPVQSIRADDWDFTEEEPGGSWIALKFDRKSDTLSVASDTFLLQRWYYYQADRRWYFSNSLRYLHEHARPRPEIDEHSVPYMLVFNYMPNRFTPLKNVFSVRPGECLTVERGKHRIQERAHLPLERPDADVYAGLNADELRSTTCEGVLRVIRGAVADELMHLDSVTIPISGGVDSRITLGCALEVMPKDRILTYTYGHPNSYDFRLGTGLARQLGLQNTPIPMDERPLDDLMRDGFQQNEGMYLAFPNAPIGPLCEVLEPGTHVLSGFLGDTMWGAEDISGPGDLKYTGDMSEHLVKLVLARAQVAPFTTIRKYLATDDWDAFGYLDAIRSLPGATLDERYSRWYASDRDTNRINFAVQMHRDRAFFLAPHVHPRVVRFAHAMPVQLRREGIAYRAAMKLAFPDLYGFPTTRNYGYPLECDVKWRRRIVRRWWMAREEFEKITFRLTGKLHFYPPMGRQYAHPLELQKRKHRPIVLQCLEELRPMNVLNPQGIAELRDAYYHRRPHSWQMVRALVTVQQWQKHYQ